jgi:hypothetical protein
MGEENMVSIYLSVYLYLSIKKDEIMSFAEKWMELEIVMLSEISQARKAKYQASSFVCKA